MTVPKRSPEYQELLDTQANGWVVVYIGSERTPKTPIFANVTGPFDDEGDATRYAAKLRRNYKRAALRGESIASDMVKISVRPLWKTDIEGALP
jgi:hypothetical protein